MKYKKILLFLLLIIAITFILCSCTDQGLRGGCLADDGNNIIEPVSAIVCGYMSDKTEFNVNDVTLTFNYGAINEVSSEKHYYEEFYKVKTILKFSSDNKEYEVKVIDDTIFNKEKYVVMNKKRGVFEEYTIPAYFFDSEQGVIYFWVFQLGLIEEGDTEWEELGGSGVNIYYRKLNQDIVELSNKPFDKNVIIF